MERDVRRRSREGKLTMFLGASAAALTRFGELTPRSVVVAAKPGIVRPVTDLHLIDVDWIFLRHDPHSSVHRRIWSAFNRLPPYSKTLMLASGDMVEVPLARA